MSARVEFESELKLGLRDMWYPICQSDHVKTKPIGLHRLGWDIVVWRDSRGTIHIHDDRCLHRGAKLSLGRILGDTLRCAYHGWCYDTSGQCVAIPASKTAQAKLAPRLRLESLEVQEHAGLVWAYFPESDHSGPSGHPSFSRRGNSPPDTGGVARSAGVVINGTVPDLVLPQELEDAAWSGFICEAEWKANWILVLENLADPMHGPFLHGQSLTLSRGALEDDMRTTRNPDGFTVERAGQRGVNFDWSEFYCRDSMWVRLDIPLPFGPKGILRILCFCTPIDENRSLVYFLRYRNLTGLKRAYWRFLYKTFWERQHFKVIDQDRAILESQRGAESRVAEHLANSDRGVTELRKLLRERIACRTPQ